MISKVIEWVTSSTHVLYFYDLKVMVLYVDYIQGCTSEWGFEAGICKMQEESSSSLTLFYVSFLTTHALQYCVEQLFFLQTVSCFCQLWIFFCILVFYHVCSRSIKKLSYLKQQSISYYCKLFTVLSSSYYFQQLLIGFHISIIQLFLLPTLIIQLSEIDARLTPLLSIAGHMVLNYGA